MLERIKNLNPWVFAIILAIGIKIFLIILTDVLNNYNYKLWLETLGYIFITPSLKILGYETVNYINEFANKAYDTEHFLEVAFISSLGVFVIFILTPFLLVKGYVKVDKSENKKERPWVWYLGAILVVITLMPLTTFSAIGTKIYINTNNSIKISQNEDQLRAQLMNLALDASYTMLLPQEHGGGDGSFTGFDGNSSRIQLADLDSYDPSLPFDFEILENISDSLITIVGVSEFDGRQDTFENINGEIGKRQLSVVVTPYEEDIFSIRTSSLTN